VCTRFTANMKLVQFPRSRSRSTLRLTIASVWPLAYLLPPQSPLIASEPLAKGIQDNSFFIEDISRESSAATASCPTLKS
jgi:hypothetical protein